MLVAEGRVLELRKCHPNQTLTFGEQVFFFVLVGSSFESVTSAEINAMTYSTACIQQPSFNWKKMSGS